MSAAYEVQAQKQHLNAIEAAGFEIQLYQAKTHGLACTCHRDFDKDILNKSGHMSPNDMNVVMQQAMFNSNRTDFVIGAVDYGDSQAGKIETFDEFRNRSLGIEEDPDKDEDIDEDDLDDEDIADMQVEKYGMNDTFGYFSPIASNCPVCARTGHVGGYTIPNGQHIVLDCQSFEKTSNLEMDKTQSPFLMKVLGDDYQLGELQFASVLPKNVARVSSIRLLDGYKARPKASYVLQIRVASTWVAISSRHMLRQYCDGKSHQFRLLVTGGQFTHFEMQLITVATPLFVDLTNFNRVKSSKRLNDLDSITVNIPTLVGTVNRNDVFFEKTSKALWIISSVEVVRSAIMDHAFNVTAERVKSSYEPFALPNPFQYSIEEVK
jgi:hypothetical protein